MRGVALGCRWRNGGVDVAGMMRYGSGHATLLGSGENVVWRFVDMLRFGVKGLAWVGWVGESCWMRFAQLSVGLGIAAGSCCIDYCLWHLGFVNADG